jgi:NAD(P)-dependent dehydrogenase (short-subunit alcohol dehydrogenase family)
MELAKAKLLLLLASKGIGKAIAEELAKRRPRVICACGQALLTEVAAAIRQQSDTQVLPVSADLSTLDGGYGLW